MYQSKRITPILADIFKAFRIFYFKVKLKNQWQKEIILPKCTSMCDLKKVTFNLIK